MLERSKDLGSRHKQTLSRRASYGTFYLLKPRQLQRFKVRVSASPRSDTTPNDT